MPKKCDPKNNTNQPVIYQIRIKGYLDSEWSDWFEGMIVTLEGDDITCLTGPVIDQAALHGLLRKIRDLGIPLISVGPVACNQENAPDIQQ